MQATREHILRLLKESGRSTVDELSRALGLTPVTVRHHLDILRGEGLVAAPLVRRRKAPGRPQHVYTLTEDASKHFPKRYDHLASMMLTELRALLSPEDLEAMMERIGLRIADQAEVPADADTETKLVSIVEYLNERGYLASWEEEEGAYLLHVANCPFEQVSILHSEVCVVDMTMLTRLLGRAPERVTWASQTDRQCTYIIHPDGE